MKSVERMYKKNLVVNFLMQMRVYGNDRSNFKF